MPPPQLVSRAFERARIGGLDGPDVVARGRLLSVARGCQLLC